MSYDFYTQTHGKWILTGEHAVIRGHAALVFPIACKKLTLAYRQTQQPITIEVDGQNAKELQALLRLVLEKAYELIGQSPLELSGDFLLTNSIPIGVGMGASAALCVAVSRWLAHQMLISEENVLLFAKQLEHLFHGQSSGLDVAGVSATTPIYFQSSKYQSFQPQWQPHWFLSFSGQVGITASCIQQVNELSALQKERAMEIDAQMAESTKLAKHALEHHTNDSHQQLIGAIQQASDCFKAWGLISDALAKHMQQLKSAGAHAVKPTGSGGGGYVLSIWKTMPSPEMIHALSLINLTA